MKCIHYIVVFLNRITYRLIDILTPVRRSYKNHTIFIIITD